MRGPDLILKMNPLGWFCNILKNRKEVAMGYGIRLLVWGERASFNRPEMKVERVTYDVMTPSAARGILEAIYWKPEMRWVIDRIRVLNPIRFSNIRRNELGGKISVNLKNAVAGGEMGVQVAERRQQRASVILLDVRYGIEAHVEVRNPGDNAHPEAKHLEMFKRRAEKGQYFSHPFFGNREFPVDFEPVEEFPAPDASLAGEKDLGYMLNDLRFIADPKGKIVESNGGERRRVEPVFFRAKMVDGVIDVPPLSGEGRADA